MNLLEHKRYLEITTVIANLESKLQVAKDKNPKLDYKEQEFIISVLKDYHYSYMELQEENRIMDKKYIKLANKYEIVFNNMHEQIIKSKELENEIITLKDNI